MQIFLHLGHGLASAVCWPGRSMGLPFAYLVVLWVCRLLTWRSYGSAGLAVPLAWLATPLAWLARQPKVLFFVTMTLAENLFSYKSSQRLRKPAYRESVSQMWFFSLRMFNIKRT